MTTVEFVTVVNNKMKLRLKFNYFTTYDNSLHRHLFIEICRQISYSLRCTTFNMLRYH